MASTEPIPSLVPFLGMLTFHINDEDLFTGIRSPTRNNKDERESSLGRYKTMVSGRDVMIIQLIYWKSLCSSCDRGSRGKKGF